ncbi:PadR family transcriptional regulator [Bacillus mojavensis]|uniref:PadR family transcriptional regulator n=1 Tax=Bacillus mojavensis TaxID=72360 RepID=UPI002DBFADB6|nr:PadR family transcriptional regulator [Bacillus mojavensis]MEC1672982.1 PadR family transcriptional regulator [Bacillus mojavensis]MEC1750822.1 PadR family transcriptional regulator [Bacillus mojavensis]
MKENKHLPLTETVYYVLLSLLHPAHGYIVMKNIEDLSGGRVKMAPGTLYGAIENLLKYQLIEPYPSEDRRRKTYIITELGRNVLWKDMERMERLVDITRQEVNKKGETI